VHKRSKPRNLKLCIQRPKEYYQLSKGEPYEGQLIAGKLVGKGSISQWTKCDVCGKGQWVTVANLKQYVYGGRCHDCISKSKAYRANVANGLYSRYKNPDEHEKSSLATVKMWAKDPIRKEKQDNVLRVLSKDDRIIKIRKEWSRQYWDDPEFGEVRRRKMGESASAHVRRMWQDEDMSKQIKDKMVEKFKDKEYKEKQLKLMREAQNHKQTKPEKELMNLLDKLYPKQWKYTGDWSFVVGGKNPDFTNINGKKQVMELFGTYHHGYKLRHECPLIHQLDRIDSFTAFGYDTLIIWEHEMKDIASVTDKVLNFCN
jgi:hypothetical protein